MAESDFDKRRATPLHNVDLVTVDTYHRPAPADDKPVDFVLIDPPTRHVVRPSPGLATIAIGLALAIAAFGIRWPLIERGETLLHPDEAVVGIMAQDISAGRSFPVYFYGQRYMGALEAYVVAAVSPLFADPIHALRCAPAIFFALLVAAQYLMLTRWFGRRGGLVGAAVLIAGSPMFAQWSISARGGYIEILLWGTLLLWAYSEWFMRSRKGGATRTQRFAIGTIVGSGFWINPSILFFALPLVGHALLTRLPLLERGTARIRNTARGIRCRLGQMTLPVFATATIVLLNVSWSVCVEDGEVQTRLLLGLFSTAATLVTFGIVACAIAWWTVSRTAIVPAIRGLAARNSALLLGALIGAAPALWYVVSHVLSATEMDSALPLGFRPIWMAGETLIYFLCGLPLMFGADPRPFMAHVTVGRDHAIEPFDIFISSLVSVADRLTLASIAACISVFVIAYRQQIRRMLSFRGAARHPVSLLALGAGTTIVLYLLGGCSCSFTTIRYLLPLWAFIPGLVAAVAVNRKVRAAGTIAPLILCAAWLSGQYAMCRSLGAPHPLRVVADALAESRMSTATAEILDAHLLSYLTGQSCRVHEFEPFWPRLGHYERGHSGDDSAPIDYIVNTSEFDRTSDWTDPGYPGPPPPETQRALWPKLKRAIQLDPGLVQQRESLSAGYERIRLSSPICH